MNYAKIASAGDFRSPRSSDQRRFRQASGHYPRTSDQATATRATGLARTQSLSDHGQTDSDFDYRWVFSHTRKSKTGHAHTHGATAVMTYAAFDFRDSSFQCFTLFSEAALKASCFWKTVSLTSGVSWVTNFLPNYSSLLLSSLVDNRQIKVQLITVLSRPL